MPDDALEHALDELYASDPVDFVELRKQLVANLRTGGDRAGANLLKGARRPSTSAWALNQLARTQPDLVEALLERSNELRAVQSRPRAGDIDVLQDTIRAHRRALADATDAALAILGPRANEAFLSEINSTLRAASTDADVGRDLERGRLVREADSSAGFPDATHLTLVPDAPAEKPPPKTRAKPSGASPDAAKAAETAREAAREAELEAAREAEREAKRRAERALRDEAREQAAAAVAAATEAAARVKELEAQLDAARRDLREARERARKAKVEAARVR